MGGGDERAAVDSLVRSGWELPQALAGDGARTWTLVGTVGARWIGAVDPRGLVTPLGPGSRWSLDWWVGADDRWHLPSRDAGVRQHLLDGAPVVETRMRIPGGEAVQRVFGMRGSGFAGGDEWLVVEVENRSAAPLAITFAVRPFTPEQVTSLTSITMEPVTGGVARDPAQLVTLDGRAALVLPRRPSRMAASTANLGDVAAAVQAGEAPVVGVDPWSGVLDERGRAQVALVYPLAHTATMRVVLPLGADPGSVPCWPQVIPPVAHVVAGWGAHVERGMRISIPEAGLSDAVTAARQSLLAAPLADGMLAAGPRIGRGGAGGDLADEAVMVAALDRAAHHDEAARAMERWPALLSRLGSPAPEADVAMLDAVATHRLVAGDQDLFDALMPDVVAATSRLDRAAKRGGLDRAVRRHAHRALRALADALERSEQPEGAADIRSLAERMGAVPGHDDQGVVAGARAQLRAAADAILRGKVAGHGLLIEATAGASATFGFADHGEPQDLVSAALLCDAVRALLVQDTDAGIALLPVFPPQWYGGSVEVHDAPTAHGRMSYALRWHGTRPALLWESASWPEVGAVRTTAPGLDARWSSVEPEGEALLAEVDPPAGLEPVRFVTEHPPDGATFA